MMNNPKTKIIMNYSTPKVKKANFVNTLEVLHDLWLSNRISSSLLETILKEDYGVQYEIIGPKIVIVREIETDTVFRLKR